VESRPVILNYIRPPARQSLKKLENAALCVYYIYIRKSHTMSPITAKPVAPQLSTQLTREVVPVVVSKPLPAPKLQRPTVPTVPTALPRFNQPSVLNSSVPEALPKIVNQPSAPLPVTTQGLFDENALVPKARSGTNAEGLGSLGKPFALKVQRPVVVLAPAPAPTLPLLRDTKTGSLRDRSAVEAVVNFGKGATSTALVQAIQDLSRTGSQLRGNQLDSTPAQLARQRLQSTTPSERFGIGAAGATATAIAQAAGAVLSRGAAINAARSGPGRQAFVPGRVYRDPDTGVQTIDIKAQYTEPTTAKPQQEPKVTQANLPAQLAKAKSPREVANLYAQAPGVEQKPGLLKQFKEAFARVGQNSDADRLGYYPVLQARQGENIPPSSNSLGKVIDPSTIPPSAFIDFSKVSGSDAFSGLQTLERGDPSPKLQQGDGKYSANQYFRNAFRGLGAAFGTTKLTENQISLTANYAVSTSGDFDKKTIQNQLDPNNGYYGVANLPAKILRSPGPITNFTFRASIHDMHLFFTGFQRLFTLPPRDLQLAEIGESSYVARATLDKEIGLQALPKDKVERHQVIENNLKSKLSQAKQIADLGDKRPALIETAPYRELVELSNQTFPKSNASPVREDFQKYKNLGFFANPGSRPELFSILKNVVDSPAVSVQRIEAIEKLAQIDRLNTAQIDRPSIAALTGQVQLVEALNMYVHGIVLPNVMGEPVFDFKDFYNFYVQQVDQGNLVTYQQVENLAKEVKIDYRP
jgi:hypothetical protein